VDANNTSSLPEEKSEEIKKEIGNSRKNKSDREERLTRKCCGSCQRRCWFTY
jgi:formate dehydrogenase assembly factor FdhD